MIRSAHLQQAKSKGPFQYITAAVCAFSVPFRMTQRDGRQGGDLPSSRTLLRPACLYRTG
jgi:hypothetical protein